MDEPAWAKGRPKPPAWRSGPPTMVFDNSWIRVESSEALAPTGNPALYGVIRFKSLAVAVLPLHDDGAVTLVGQQRFALRDYSWELPEGGVPFDEDPLEGAKRELREETGLLADHWREILRVQLSNSVTDERGVCYLAAGFREVGREPDATEALDVVRAPFRQVLDACATGLVQDVMTVASVFRVHHMAVSGELSPELARLVLS